MKLLGFVFLLILGTGRRRLLPGLVLDHHVACQWQERCGIDDRQEEVRRRRQGRYKPAARGRGPGKDRISRCRAGEQRGRWCAGGSRRRGPQPDGHRRLAGDRTTRGPTAVAITRNGKSLGMDELRVDMRAKLVFDHANEPRELLRIELVQ